MSKLNIDNLKKGIVRSLEFVLFGWWLMMVNYGKWLMMVMLLGRERFGELSHL